MNGWGYWNKKRIYKIQKSFLKEGKNKIAIRAIDTGGPGRFEGVMNIYNNIGDTIQAVKQHNSHTFFKDIGTADLTHLIDFSALARQTEAQQARFIGPVFQADFLKELGLFERTEALRRPDQPEFNRLLVASAERLTSPAQMGQIFKVALLVPAGDGLPAGFASLNESLNAGRDKRAETR